MVFYVENDNKFHLYYSSSDIIFVMYEDAIQHPHITQVRWKAKLAFNDDHIENIINKLKSPEKEVRETGKRMLEQSLNVKIYGEVVGHYEGAPI